MKTIVTIALLFTCFFTVSTVSAQEGTVTTTTAVSTSTLETPAAVVAEAQMSDWFSGQVAPTQEASSNDTQKRSLVPNKKEMYLQSGLSNRTLLIRSLLKKADSYMNGLA